MRAGLPPNTGGTAEKIFRPGHDGSRARGFVISLGKEHRHETGLPEIQTLRPPSPCRTAPGRTRPSPRPPVWCSVRPAGRQPGPGKPHETLEQKLEFFQTLCEIGFTEIEVGFPRLLRDGVRDLTCPHRPGPDSPTGVTVQVLVQAREHLIRKTFEAIRGAQKCHHPLLQLHLHPSAAGGVPHGHGGRHPDRRRCRPAYPPPHRGAHGQRGRGHPLRVLPRELFRHPRWRTPCASATGCWRSWGPARSGRSSSTCPTPWSSPPPTPTPTRWSTCAAT